MYLTRNPAWTLTLSSKELAVLHKVLAAKEGESDLELTDEDNNLADHLADTIGMMMRRLNSFQPKNGNNRHTPPKRVITTTNA